MNLYGREMDEGVSRWRRTWADYRPEPADRNFIGREALEMQREKAPSSWLAR